MKKLEFQIIIWKEGTHWVAQCLNVDVSSFGGNQKSALNNIREALELYFEGAKSPKVTRVMSPVIRSTTLQYA